MADVASSEFVDFAPSDKTQVICEDGIYYSWLPTYKQPSVITLHRWNPDIDVWIETEHTQFLPSRSWGTNTRPN